MTLSGIKLKAITLAKCHEDLDRLPSDQIEKLFYIIWDLHEAFDGEDVDAPCVVRLMAMRYVRFGMKPVGHAI
jgi:hypothetical protein